jgi:hypothetical protein
MRARLPLRPDRAFEVAIMARGWKTTSQCKRGNQDEGAFGRSAVRAEGERCGGDFGE